MNDILDIVSIAQCTDLKDAVLVPKKGACIGIYESQYERPMYFFIQFAKLNVCG